MSDEKDHPQKLPEMQISLDRPHRVKTTIAFWGALIIVGVVLAGMMLKFTGNVWLGVGLAGGMLLYMVAMAAVTSKNLSKSPGDGRIE